MNYVLGIDISTTGAKALLLGDGRIIASHTVGQTVSTPHPLWSEQDPEDWWAGVSEAIRSVLVDTKIDPAAISAVGVTGQMHGLVLLDSSGKVLRPAILWNDQRTQAQCDQITEAIGQVDVIRITGSRVLTGFTAPKLLWVRRHEPGVYRRIAHILLPKDYIRFRLTGEYATDTSDASGTSLLDVGARAWSTKVVDTLEIRPEWLPWVFEGPEVTGIVHATASKATGLFAGTPVVAGAGDQAAAAIGMGLTAPGLISVTVGTSGVVFAPLDHYIFEPHGSIHAFCHAVPGLWHWMGVMLSAAGALQWYRDALAPNIRFDTLLDEAETVSAGSDGLLFLPYLSGERTPHPDPLARGAFIGLTARHGRAHMTRAVLEGVAFGLKDSLSLMRDGGVPMPEVVRLAGGGSRGSLWRQIIADVLDLPVETAPTSEGSALGAGVLATLGAGWYHTVEDACAEWIGEGELTYVSDDRARYADLYPVYRTLYPTLHDIFPQLV